MKFLWKKQPLNIRLRSLNNEPKFSYELCGGTHLERTSDIGAFIIVSEGSAAAGVRRIEAVTGRGAYELIARRFKALKQTASALKSGIDEVPQKVEMLEEELSEAKKEIASLRTQQALIELQRSTCQHSELKDVHVLAADIPNADADTLRSSLISSARNIQATASSFLRQEQPLIAVLTEDLVKRGLKAGDIITAIGGRGGGRPNMAQGSLPDASKVNDALSKVAKIVEEKLK